jgi:DNA topoisomerase I
MPRWITRHGSKRATFQYRDRHGRPVREPRVLERIDALRIPPGWHSVHIAVSERAAIQAWGIDAKGRKQYRYHQRAVRRSETAKFFRVRSLARDLPRIRESLYRDFCRTDFCRERVLAAVVRLISDGFFRVGSERYLKENRTFGISTLHKSHVRVDGPCLIFEYRGKRRIYHRQVVVDPELAAFLGLLLAAPGRRLFRYQDGDSWCDLDARDVNQYLRKTLGVRYTAKDFRTWGGTLRLATVLAELGPAGTEREAKRNVVMAVRMVAAELGNTPAVCRKSYVHPIVIARYLDAGDTIARGLARVAPQQGVARHHPEERALLHFLDRHFPERRRRARPKVKELEPAAAA